MKRRAWGDRWLVLVSLAGACGDPTATVTRKAGSLLANDQAFAVHSWIALAPDAVTREWPAAVATGEKLYVMGGWSGSVISSDLRAFDPVADSWMPLSPMPNPVYASLGAQALAGQIFVVGGELQPGVPGAIVSVYDPPSNTWTTTTPLPVAAGCGGSGVIAGTLYALTGCEVTNMSHTGSLYSYNRVTTQWTARASNPIPREYPAVAVAGGMLYAAGGILSNGRASGDLTVFSPGTGAWQTKAPIPVPRYGAVAVPYGPKLAVFGGFDLSGRALDDLWIYDPSANSWLKPASSGFVARGYLAAAVAAGAAYAVGGRLLSMNNGTPTNVLQRIFP